MAVRSFSGFYLRCIQEKTTPVRSALIAHFNVKGKCVTVKSFKVPVGPALCRRCTAGYGDEAQH